MLYLFNLYYISSAYNQLIPPDFDLIDLYMISFACIWLILSVCNPFSLFAIISSCIGSSQHVYDQNNIHSVHSYCAGSIWLKYDLSSLHLFDLTCIRWDRPVFDQFDLSFVGSTTVCLGLFDLTCNWSTDLFDLNMIYPPCICLIWPVLDGISLNLINLICLSSVQPLFVWLDL